MHELKDYCTSQGLPFRILMVLDNAPAHPHVLQDLHYNIKFVFLPPNTVSLLQPMDQGVIQMFRAHYLQKMWCALVRTAMCLWTSLRQPLEKTEVKLQKDVVRCHWRSYSIHNAIWQVHNAWKEVTES